MVRFSERLMWLPSRMHDSRLESGCRNGIYLGLDDVTGQRIVGTEEGLGFARSLRRVIPELQTNTVMFNK